MKPEEESPESWGVYSKLVLAGIERLENQVDSLNEKVSALGKILDAADLVILKRDVEELKEFRTQSKTIVIAIGVLWTVVVMLLNKYWK